MDRLSGAAPRRSTLRDVARRAGVSFMTVSNVMNGNFGQMRADTRERVEQAIRDLGYRPRGMARGLRLDKNFAVGLLIVDPLSSFLADQFISQVVAGASNVLGATGYGCLVHGVPPEHFERAIFFAHSRVDGLCAFLSGAHEARRSYMQRLIALGVPVIGIEEADISLEPDCATVRQDDFGAAVRLAQALLDQGVRRFHVLAPSMPWPSVTQRVAGMRLAIEKAGGGAELILVTCGTGTIAEAEAIVPGEVVAFREDAAVVGASDRLAIAAARIAPAIPSIAGPPRIAAFSASETTRDMGIFDVIAVSDPYRIGEETGRLMLDRLERGRFESRDVVVPLEVRVRAHRITGAEA